MERRVSRLVLLQWTCENFDQDYYHASIDRTFDQLATDVDARHLVLPIATI